MPMTSAVQIRLTPLQTLAQAYGISLEFTDAFNQVQNTSPYALEKVLNALGVSPCDTDSAAKQRLVEWEEAQWKPVLAPMTVWRQGDVQPLRIQLNFMPKSPLDWKITDENGKIYTGQVALNPLNKVDEKSFERRGLIFSNKALHFAWHWHIEAELPQGYHQIELTYRGERLVQSKLAVTPRHAYIPAAMQQHQVWGVSSQLYSFKSSQNYGIGDVNDLHRLVDTLAEVGASAIGLNPLHQVFPHDASAISPYSPSSRLFLNWLYIHPQNSVDFHQSDVAQLLYNQNKNVIESARNTELVDYETVADLKRPILEAMFQSFSEHHLAKDTDRAKAYVAFMKREGDALHKLALYEALSEDFYNKDASLWGWPVWPEAFRNPDSPEVKTAAVRLNQRVQFFAYLQFLMDEQLTAVAHHCDERQLEVGLYMDLAVGSGIGGADVWMNRSLYSTSASVGCPPDLFNQLGQNWGLPPIRPEALKAQQFEPFIELLRANMKYAGALRIDHALAMFRAYWIPSGETGQNGAYVNYPSHELLGLIALESQRAKCLVIGEDLGTVPNWVRDTFMDWNIFSYRIFYFERGEGNQYIAPQDYPENALVTISTHDLPTLQSYWQGKDITLRNELKLFPTQEKFEEEWAARPFERQALLDALIHNNVMPEGYSHNQADYPEALPQAIAHAVDAFLAHTPSKLRMLQLEDAFGLTSQVNMPGTVNEHPNWRRKHPLNVDDLKNIL